MKLRENYNNPDAMIAYILDTNDGERVKSEMPATVAEEIAQRADTVSLRDEEGFELSVNGKMYFPKDIFDFDEGEVEGLEPKRGGRAKRAEKRGEA